MACDPDCVFDSGVRMCRRRRARRQPRRARDCS